jgi:hypothetical protein
MTAFEVWRAEHIAELEKLRTQLQDFLIPPEKRIELALKIIAQDAKLKGTEAATRSENVNVNLDGDAIGPYRQFVLASRGLDAEQVEQLLTLAVRCRANHSCKWHRRSLPHCGTFRS